MPGILDCWLMSESDPAQPQAGILQTELTQLKRQAATRTCYRDPHTAAPGHAALGGNTPWGRRALCRRRDGLSTHFASVPASPATEVPKYWAELWVLRSTLTLKTTETTRVSVDGNIMP